MSESLLGQRVSFRLADNSMMDFRVSGTVDYDGDTYALLEEEGGDQLLIALIADQADGVSFMPVQEAELINAVCEQYTADSIRSALDQDLPDPEDSIE